jgi:Zn-dependent protease
MNTTEIILVVIPLVIAITLHEAAHGFVASKLGDQTARIRGRVTFNPLKHIDLFGTLILPGMLLLSGAPVLFGYAKPVPVDYQNLRRPRLDAALVALAGPGTNLILAFLSALALHLEAVITPEQAPWTFMILYRSVMVNVILAVFNMLPILPLDGGRILNTLLPRAIARFHARTERYGMAIVLLLFLLPAFMQERHMQTINFSYWLISLPSSLLRDLVLHAAGIGNG